MEGTFESTPHLFVQTRMTWFMVSLYKYFFMTIVIAFIPEHDLDQTWKSERPVASNPFIYRLIFYLDRNLITKPNLCS